MQSKRLEESTFACVAVFLVQSRHYLGLVAHSFTAFSSQRYGSVRAGKRNLVHRSVYVAHIHIHCMCLLLPCTSSVTVRILCRSGLTRGPGACDS